MPRSTISLLEPLSLGGMRSTSLVKTRRRHASHWEPKFARKMRQGSIKEPESDFKLTIDVGPVPTGRFSRNWPAGTNPTLVFDSFLDRHLACHQAPMRMLTCSMTGILPIPELLNLTCLARFSLIAENVANQIFRKADRQPDELPINTFQKTQLAEACLWCHFALYDWLQVLRPELCRPSCRSTVGKPTCSRLHG